MRVYIGIPIYGGADAQFISSLLKLRVVLCHLGWETEVDLHNGCSILTKARNEITQRFYESGFDVLLFLDADMVFDPVSVINMLRDSEEFSAIPYRYKNEEEKYTCIVNDDVEFVGTGCIALKRSCIEKMLEAYKDLKYTDKGKEYYALFDFILDSGRYWGEDYVFCQRWRDIGGKITIHSEEIGHIGSKTYTGKYKHETRS